ncbi:alpha/beta hydrolase [Mycolicibacterium komossense]|uniref:Alpha/beta hydrolase n=1 Tax=Mycolicibacterium komossense TaxID=1779 RepID=A0ABT3CH47_9MYCO|nr:alpha/beta hydrolase [Mycolicibacterium komossense]MCV7228790.1 alpha/beta hydrolase [Mycolicibacterium komossense]
MTYAFDPELLPTIDMLPKRTSVVVPVEESRRQIDELFSSLIGDIDRTGVELVHEEAPGPAGAVPLRIFVPDVRTTRGAVYDVHGGGFTVGSAAMDDAANIAMARELGVVVVSVEYRLAPETPFPGPLEDCYAGLVWVAENTERLGIDPANIVIHGVSAGGGLCAALALLARDRGGPAIAFQYLGVPELDDRLATTSMQSYVDTPLWNLPAAENSWDSYLGKGVRGTADVSPYAAPSRATDLTGLPPAYISAMQFDPLRDEDIAYAQGLLAAGVTVELHLFPGTFHGSMLAVGAAVSKREAAEAIAVLRRALKVPD